MDRNAAQNARADSPARTSPSHSIYVSRTMSPRQPCVLQPKSGPGGRPTLFEPSAIKVFPCLFAHFAWSRHSRPKCQPEVFTQFSRFTCHVSRQCHPQIALFPRCFCAVFKGGIYYSLLPNHLRSRNPKRRNSLLTLTAKVPSASRRCAPSFHRGNAQRSPWPVLAPLPRHPRSIGTLPTFRQPTANLCQPMPT
jgi:hypothetical protein